MDDQAEDVSPKGKPTKDRRDHESWLHDALELSLHHRFQRGNVDERALILHGQRSDAHPDFALLDASQKLTLVELKVGELTRADASDVVEQMRRYVRDYRTRRLEELATWYCHHGVDVNTRFGYRGEKYIKNDPKDGNDYGRLNRWVLKSLERYRGPFGKDKTDALKILKEDYEHHVAGAKLDVSNPSKQLQVDRCILIAQKWPEGVPREPIEGARVELWTYPAPVEWVGPGARHVKASPMNDPAGVLPPPEPALDGPAIATAVDSAGARYVQVDLGGGYRFRVTRTKGREYFPDGKGLRFQIQDTNGHMPPGPEVGLDRIDQVLAAIAIAAAGHR